MVVDKPLRKCLGSGTVSAGCVTGLEGKFDVLKGIPARSAGCHPVETDRRIRTVLPPPYAQERPKPTEDARTRLMALVGAPSFILGFDWNPGKRKQHIFHPVDRGHTG